MGLGQCRSCVSLGQLKVMSAIESCRTAALGGHVARCENWAHSQISSQTPAATGTAAKCRGRGAKIKAGRARGRSAAGAVLSRRAHAAWSDRRYRLPEQDRHLRPAVRYLGREPRSRLADDPEHPGRLHWHHLRAGTSWGSAMTHHPHVHMIVPGGGISPDGERRWVASRPASSRRCACSRLLAAIPGDGCSPPTILEVLRLSRRSPTRGRSRPGWHRYAEPNGLCPRPSVRSAAHRPCYHSAIPIASPSPTAG